MGVSCNAYASPGIVHLFDAVKVLFWLRNMFFVICLQRLESVKAEFGCCFFHHITANANIE